MFYRVIIIGNFPNWPPPGWLASFKALLEVNAITINPGQPVEEKSSYQLHNCFHDEAPALPCELIDEWHSS